MGTAASPRAAGVPGGSGTGLASWRRARNRLQARLRTLVVEVDEEVVCDEWHWRTLFGLELEGRYPQRKEQLVARAVTESRNLDRLVIRSVRQQRRGPLVVVDTQLLKRTERQILEDRAGTLQ